MGVKKGPMIPVGAVVSRRDVSGPLGKLVKGGEQSMSPTDKVRVQCLTERANAQTGHDIERLSQPPMRVEIAVDYSGSTSALSESLRHVATALQVGIAVEHPLARISFGVFGGKDLVKNGQAKRVLDDEHISTDSWESTFGQFLSAYTRCISEGAFEDVLISVHDATPRLDEELFANIRKINAGGATVLIIFYPTQGSSDEDKRVLRELCDPDKAFKRAFFIDLSSVNVTDQAVVKQLIMSFVDAIAISEREARKVAGSNKVLADNLSRTSLGVRLKGVVRALGSNLITDNKGDE